MGFSHPSAALAGAVSPDLPPQLMAKANELNSRVGIVNRGAVMLFPVVGVEFASANLKVDQ
tara:strand:- start:441 stop:623 length:183 start_codon:yes stop_codon:yes gene_type:complete